MSDPIFSLPLSVAHLGKIASDDENRVALTHVLVHSIGENRAVAVATDGHKLVKAEFIAHVPEGRWLIKAEALLAVAKNRKAETIQVYTDKVETSFLGKTIASATEVKLDGADGYRFPDYNNVVPKAIDYVKAPKCPEIGFDFLVMADVLACAKELAKDRGAHMASASWMFSDELSPALVILEKASHSLEQVLFVIMPCRLTKASEAKAA